MTGFGSKMSLGFSRPTVYIPNSPADKKRVAYRTLESDIKHYKFDTEKEELINLKKELIHLKKELTDVKQKIIDASTTSPLNIKKSYISFNEPRAHDDNIMKTIVHGIRYDDDKWIKIYTTRVAYKTIIESEFTIEVYYQKKAHGLNESCAFISPAVIDYGAFVHDKYVYHYIIMEYIPETKLNKDECEQIIKNVEAVDTCLRENGIFHNDLAARNVFSRDSKPIIIDFGQALNTEREEHLSLECNDKNTARIVTPLNDDLPPTPMPPPPPNGGKRKKTNRSKKRKRGSKKKKTRKLE